MLLASGSANGSVILWDLSQVDSIGQPLLGPNSSVAALAIDSEETILAAGYANGEVLIWNIDPDSWLQKACERVGRNLTQSEWSRYLPGVEYRETCP
jgi:WD40 repeat protein